MTMRGFKTLPLLLCGFAALPALADDRVVREYSFDLGGINEIEFNASVGSIDIQLVEGNEVKLVLEIESRDHGWFDRARDVSGIELESRVRGDRLILTQDEKETETEWTIHLPALARTSIKMGVGDIDAELGATEVKVELGVGDVDLTMPQASVGEIDLSVGVGDAHLRGGDRVNYQRAFVSQDVRGRGDGELDVDVHVGVGDVDLTLK